MKLKSFIYTFLITLFLTICFNGCYYDNAELRYPKVAACDTTNVTYALKVAPIISANCLSCHSNATYLSNGGGIIKLQDYPDVKTNINQAYNDIIIGRMPKGGAKLDDCSISLIRIWKNAGAPNN